MSNTSNTSPIATIATTAGTLAGSAIGMPWLGQVTGAIAGIANDLFGKGSYDPAADAVAREQFIAARWDQLQGSLAERTAKANQEYEQFKRQFAMLSPEQKAQILALQKRRGGAEMSIPNLPSGGTGITTAVDVQGSGLSIYDQAAANASYGGTFHPAFDMDDDMKTKISGSLPIIGIILLLWFFLKR